MAALQFRSPVPILDCHGHLGVHPDFPAYKTDAEDMLRVMDALDIERLAVTSTLACYSDAPRGNAEVAALLARHPNRFIGYVTVNPHPSGEASRELERWSGWHRPPLIKMHPDLHQAPVDAEGYRPVWEYANAQRAIVLVHTWDSDPNCGPLRLLPIALAYPRARILLGHSGVTWRGYTQAVAVARQAPNAFLDLSGSQGHRGVIEYCVAAVGAERILFGSDLPYLEASATLGRVLAAQLSDEQKRLILRENFRRLLEEEGS
ncbi:MAG: amidohydrolase family protein [Terriglobales bacterium]